MALKDLLSDVSANLSYAFNLPQGGVKNPGSNYVAAAMVLRNTLPEIGAQYTPPSGTAGTLTAANIVGYIKQLCFLDQGVFFGNGMINGKKGMPDEFMESAKYGTRTQERPTGDVKESVDFEFKHFFLNIAFFNGLRSGVRMYDFYLFTPTSVQYVRYDSDEVVFYKIGHNIDGDITKEIAGKFSVAWSREGELIPYIGVVESTLAADTMRYSFGAPTITTIVAVAGSPDRYTFTGAAAGTFRSQVVEGGTVTYYLFRDIKTSISTEGATIDSITGAVTLSGTMPAGRYTFNIVAMNTTGVFGNRQITIDRT